MLGTSPTFFDLIQASAGLPTQEGIRSLLTASSEDGSMKDEAQSHVRFSNMRAEVERSALNVLVNAEDIINEVSKYCQTSFAVVDTVTPAQIELHLLSQQVRGGRKKARTTPAFPTMSKKSQTESGYDLSEERPFIKVPNRLGILTEWNMEFLRHLSHLQSKKLSLSETRAQSSITDPEGRQAEHLDSRVIDSEVESPLSQDKHVAASLLIFDGSLSWRCVSE